MQRILYGLSAALALVGAINWGLVGLFRFNLVRKIFGASRRAEQAVYLVVGAAGAWLAIALTLPSILIALGIRGGRTAAEARYRSIVGSMLPAITGTTLGGRTVELPRDAIGKTTLLVMGFSYESRFDVEDWSEAFQARFGTNPSVGFYEMPMIGGVYRLFAPVIDAGMRQGTPTEMHDRVVTVYGPVGSIRESLGAGPSSDTWVYLLDGTGRVLYQYGGAFDQQRFQELASIVEVAIPKRAVRGRRAA